MAVTDYYYATFSVNGKTISATIHTESGFISALKQDATNEIGSECPTNSGGNPNENINEQGAVINCFDDNFRFVMTVKDSSGNTVATEYSETYNANNFSDGTDVDLSATVSDYGEYTVEIGVQAEKETTIAPTPTSTSS